MNRFNGAEKDAWVIVIRALIVLASIACATEEAYADSTNITQVFLSEVMYNPAGSDNNREFVEVIGTDNLSGFTIGDLASNDTLSLLAYAPGSVSLIVEEGFNGSGINASLWSAGSTIGDDLTNGGDTILLYRGGLMIDSMSYDGSIGNGNGKSLERDEKDTWVESTQTGGTPGIAPEWFDRASNNTSMNSSNMNSTNGTLINGTLINGTLNNTENNSANVTTNVTLNSTAANGTVNITGTITANITANATANVTMNITVNTSINMTGNNLSLGNASNTSNGTNSSSPFLCNGFQGINSSQKIYSEGSISYRHALNKTGNPYVIEYWIEDLQGAVIKDKAITTNTNEKTYTPSYQKGSLVLLLKARLIEQGCPGAGAETLVIVNGTPLAPIICASASKSTSSTTNKGSSCATGLNEGIKDATKKEQENRTRRISIESFYTRSKVWKERINLSARIEGDGVVRVTLVSPLEIISQNITIENASSTITLPVLAPNQASPIVLIAEQLIPDGRDRGLQVSASVLVLNLSGGPATETQGEQDAFRKNARNGTIATASAGASTIPENEAVLSTQGESFTKGHAGGEATGEVVYATAEQNVMRKIPLVLSALAVMGGIAWWQWRKKHVGNAPPLASSEENKHTTPVNTVDFSTTNE